MKARPSSSTTRQAGTVAAAKDATDIEDEGLEATEGTVINIDRGRRQITIRFDSGKSDTFHLTDRAAADVRVDAGPGDADTTCVYRVLRR